MELKLMKQMMKASGCSNSGNQYAWFRAEFPANAEIQIYADDFYELWNNGKFLAYGPARSGEPLLYFDRFQLSGSRNHVTVKVHGRKRVPQLFCNSPGVVAYWRAKRSNAYDSNAPYTIGDAGFTEFCNLDVEEADYVLAAFDDSDWLPAVEGRVLQASHLLPRPIPLFRETERKPLRITRKNGETLADFGEMVFGRLEIAGHKSANAEITIEYIEDLKSGWAHAEGRRAMYADRLTGHVTDFHWKSFNKRGFRYIAVCGNLESVPSIRLLEYAYPLQENGTFLCSDSALNNLWKISERTLRICMDDLFNDCPHRDQAQWMDAFVSSKAALSLFGITDLTHKCILQHAVCSFRHGKLLSPSIHGWSFMPDYAMIQILFIRWYFLVTNDMQLLAELWSNCAAGVDHMHVYRQSDGLLANVEGAYLDNAFELCRLGKSAAMNALYYAALNAMAELAAVLGKTCESTAYYKEAEMVKQAFHRVFDIPDGTGTLRDSSDRPERSFYNYNFSCEFGGRFQGKTARAVFQISPPVSGCTTLYSAAFGPYRIFCNGVKVLDDNRPAAWTRPLPAYEPHATDLELHNDVNTIIFEVDCNFLNWDLFFDAEGVEWGEGTLWEFDPADNSILSPPHQAAPRHWEPPAFSQATHGYAAYAGLIGNSALCAVLPDEYFRNYISIRVPLFSTETTDPAKLSGWVLPPNTPWTMFYFLSALFENGLADEALALLRRAWGVMLDRNAVNTWEEWNNNSSLCHAWGATPCWFFHREILGVKHEFLHRNEVVIRPALFNLEFARGRVMLGAGEWVEVELQRKADCIQVVITPNTRRQIVTDFSRLHQFKSVIKQPAVEQSADS